MSNARKNPDLSLVKCPQHGRARIGHGGISWDANGKATSYSEFAAYGCGCGLKWPEDLEPDWKWQYEQAKSIISKLEEVVHKAHGLAKTITVLARNGSELHDAAIELRSVLEKHDIKGKAESDGEA